MPRYEMQPYEPANPNEPIVGAEPPPGEAAQGLDVSGLLWGVLRRWRIVLLVWLLLAPVGVAGVWLKVQPFCTATALVEVAPVVDPVLYPDVSPTMPNYDTYLNTQVQVIGSRQVLTAALADPNVQDLAVQTSPDPVASAVPGAGGGYGAGHAVAGDQRQPGGQRRGAAAGASDPERVHDAARWARRARTRCDGASCWFARRRNCARRWRR